ncbi:hypothetical protein C1T17_12295 [Sphingobium sp. SCG-1]|nr:hypothetical protein C1T17_12295 [Sphingobium sp. SCG-1]
MIASVAPLQTLNKVGLYLLAATVAVAAVTISVDQFSLPAPTAANEVAPHLRFGPKSFAAALELAAGPIALGRERVARAPDQWAYQESYARALMGRARLTGSFDDLLAARLALMRGRADAPKGAGPLLTDAVSNLTIHRLAPIASTLTLLDGAAVPADRGDQAEALAIRGDVAFYSGKYSAAWRTYRAAAQMDNGPGIAVRAANYFKKMGRFDDAIRQLEYAMKSVKAPTPQFYANMMLQKGVIELDRGNWETATRLFLLADATFPGHWLIKAHLAQMTALGGDLDGAEQQYRTILAKAGSEIAMPEVMDALAALYRARGDAKNSRYWSDRAGALWTRRLSQLPEAAYGPALEHELVLGNPARALDLARLNFAARPYGDSCIMLAMALLANGRPQEAVAILKAAEQTGWRTAQQYVVLSQASAMLGQVQASEDSRPKALALNPKAFDPASSLIWFGNH